MRVLLDTSMAGRCNCIVTGDQDLLVLEGHEGCRIVHPSDFWEWEAEASGAADLTTPTS